MNTEPYVNRPYTKSRLKQVVAWSYRHYGASHTVALVQRLKELGFVAATRAGLSLGLDDLLIPPAKSDLVADANRRLDWGFRDVGRAGLSHNHYVNRVIATWTNVSELLRQELLSTFQSCDALNPVFMMAYSGARGNVSQVRQLVGMRGLMADPNGEIINFAIRSNFREGLSLTEYMIACYGSRKGVVDTALRTATSGYLTRRLVDVAQHVVIAERDCFGLGGLLLTPLVVNRTVVLPLQSRLVGRVLSADVVTGTTTLVRNHEIDTADAVNLARNHHGVAVRSALTCGHRNQICRQCYGWNLSRGRMVDLGETVGVIAAQSIGEPGTQLTMRTFHTGGVFSGNAASGVVAPCDATVDFPGPGAGIIVRSTTGAVAYLTKTPCVLALRHADHVTTSRLPAHTLILVKQGQHVVGGHVLAEPVVVPNRASLGLQTYLSPCDGEVQLASGTTYVPLREPMKDLRYQAVRNRRHGFQPRGWEVTARYKQRARHAQRRPRSMVASEARLWIEHAAAQPMVNPAKTYLRPGDRFTDQSPFSLTAAPATVGRSAHPHVDAPDPMVMATSYIERDFGGRYRHRPGTWRRVRGSVLGGTTPVPKTGQTYAVQTTTVRADSPGPRCRSSDHMVATDAAHWYRRRPKPGSSVIAGGRRTMTTPKHASLACLDWRHDPKSGALGDAGRYQAHGCRWTHRTLARPRQTQQSARVQRRAFAWRKYRRTPRRGYGRARIRRTERRRRLALKQRRRSRKYLWRKAKLLPPTRLCLSAIGAASWIRAVRLWSKRLRVGATGIARAMVAKAKARGETMTEARVRLKAEARVRAKMLTKAIVELRTKVKALAKARALAEANPTRKAMTKARALTKALTKATAEIRAMTIVFDEGAFEVAWLAFSTTDDYANRGRTILGQPSRWSKPTRQWDGASVMLALTRWAIITTEPALAYAKYVRKRPATTASSLFYAMPSPQRSTYDRWVAAWCPYRMWYTSRQFRSSLRLHQRSNRPTPTRRGGPTGCRGPKSTPNLMLHKPPRARPEPRYGMARQLRTLELGPDPGPDPGTVRRHVISMAHGPGRGRVRLRAHRQEALSALRHRIVHDRVGDRFRMDPVNLAYGLISMRWRLVTKRMRKTRKWDPITITTRRYQMRVFTGTTLHPTGPKPKRTGCQSYHLIDHLTVGRNGSGWSGQCHGGENRDRPTVNGHADVFDVVRRIASRGFVSSSKPTTAQRRVGWAWARRSGTRPPHRGSYSIIAPHGRTVGTISDRWDAMNPVENNSYDRGVGRQTRASAAMWMGRGWGSLGRRTRRRSPPHGSAGHRPQVGAHSIRWLMGLRGDRPRILRGYSDSVATPYGHVLDRENRGHIRQHRRPLRYGQRWRGYFVGGILTTSHKRSKSGYAGFSPNDLAKIDGRPKPLTWVWPKGVLRLGQAWRPRDPSRRTAIGSGMGPYGLAASPPRTNPGLRIPVYVPHGTPNTGSEGPNGPIPTSLSPMVPHDGRPRQPRRVPSRALGGQGHRNRRSWCHPWIKDAIVTDDLGQGRTLNQWHVTVSERTIAHGELIRVAQEGAHDGEHIGSIFVNAAGQPRLALRYLNADHMVHYPTMKPPQLRQVGDRIPAYTVTTSGLQVPEAGLVLAITRRGNLLRRAEARLLPTQSRSRVRTGDFVHRQRELLTVSYHNLTTGDIVQGIPKVERLFEGRRLAYKLSLPRLLTTTTNSYRTFVGMDPTLREEIHWRCLQVVQRYAMDAVQYVYQSQGVVIADKHLEVILRQMTAKVAVVHPGATGLIAGDIVYFGWIDLVQRRVEFPALISPHLLGITEASLEGQGFLSPASFQEAVRMLSRAAITMRTDFLRGLKENVIMGDVVEMGTRVRANFNKRPDSVRGD